MLPRALIFVRETSGLAAFAQALAEQYGFRFGGNELAVKALEAKGVACELMEVGKAELALSRNEAPVRLVIANFAEVESVGRGFLSWKGALGAFDREIVSLIRNAAWRVEQLAVLGNAGDYASVLEELKRGKGKLGLAFRRARSIAALRAASEFDFAVAQYLEIHGADAPDLGALGGFPQAIRFTYPRAQNLDAGENRHQRAALYGSFHEHFELAMGPALDYLSVLTVSRAAYLIGEFERPCAALLAKGRIVSLVCGENGEAATEALLESEYQFPNWLVCNQELSSDLLQSAVAKGVTGFVLPDLSQSAKDCLVEEKKTRVVISRSGMGYDALHEVRSVAGGVLVQDKDRGAINPMEWTSCSFAQVLVEDWEPLLLGARVARHLESSALVLVRGMRVTHLESYGRSADDAWGRVRQGCIDLSDTVAVFDDSAPSASVLNEMKEAGVRAVLAPFGEGLEELSAAANECGLALLGSKRSMGRL